MNITLNGTEGNLTANSTELEGLEGEEKDYSNGGHHVDAMALDELGEKDTTIEDELEAAIESGEVILDTEGEELPEGT